MTIIAKDLIERLQRVDPYARVYVGKMPLGDGPAPVAHSGVVDLEPEFQTHKMFVEDALEDAKSEMRDAIKPAREELIKFRKTLDDDSDGVDEIEAIIGMLEDL